MTFLDNNAISRMVVVLCAFAAPLLATVLLGLTVTWVGIVALSASIAAAIYLLAIAGTQSHRREMGFTYVLLIVTLLSLILPTLIIRHSPVKVLASAAHREGQERPPDIQNCLKTLFSGGTPCQLVWPLGDGHQYASLDRFLIWEFIAIAQTIVFAGCLWCELSGAHFTHVTTFIPFVIVIAALCAWYCMTNHNWPGQLVATVAFLLLIMMEDLWLWRVQTEDDKARCEVAGTNQKSKREDLVNKSALTLRTKLGASGTLGLEDVIVAHAEATSEAIAATERLAEENEIVARTFQRESVFLRQLVCAVDFPMVLAVVVVACVACKFAGSGGDIDEQLAKHFFAGGTAFSLMFGNTSLVILRILKHREVFHAVHTSFWEFIGL